MRPDPTAGLAPFGQCRASVWEDAGTGSACAMGQAWKTRAQCCACRFYGESAITGDQGPGIGLPLVRGFAARQGGPLARSLDDGLCRVTIRVTLSGAGRRAWVGIPFCQRAECRAASGPLWPRQRIFRETEKSTCGHFEHPLDTASRDDETRKRKRRNGKSRTKTNASAHGIGKHAL